MAIEVMALPTVCGLVFVEEQIFGTNDRKERVIAISDTGVWNVLPIYE